MTERRDNTKESERQLLTSALFSLCRRNQIDMTKRFRGNTPIAAAKEMEGRKSGSSDQLYAGRPAYTTVKELSGDEVQMDPEKTRGL